MDFFQLIFRFLIWLINAGFLLSVSYLIIRPLKTRRPSINLMLFGSFWVFLTTAFLLLLGLVGLFTPLWIGGLSLAGIILLLLMPGTRSRLIQGMSELSRVRNNLREFWQTFPTWLQIFTVLFIGFNLIRFGFLTWALPPFVWDSLTYHLTNVAHWIQAGRIELFDSPIIRIYTPANYEVLASWFAIFLHHDAFIEAAGIPAYLLAISALYAGIRGLGVHRSAAWMGSLAYAASPGFLIAITGTKNDPHMAAYYLVALALLIHILFHRGSNGGRKLLGPLVGLVLVILLATGTKAYIAHLLPGLVIAGLLLFLLRQPRNRIGDLVSALINEWKSWSRIIQTAVVFLILIGFFLGGYWNIRNWILKGNPFYPYGVAIEGNQILPEGDRTARFTTYRLEENLKLLSQRFWDRQDPIRPDLTNTTGWGWFAYGLGLPTALWAFGRRRQFWAIGLGFIVSLLLLMFSTRPSPWNMRYSIWFPAVFSYSFALFIESFSKPRWTKYAFYVLFAGCLGINLVSTITYNTVSVDKFDLMLERPLWGRHASILKLNMPAEYENAFLYVPEGEKLGYNVSSNGFVYPLYRADYSQELVYVPFEVEDSCNQIAERMEALGTRYLFVAPEHTSDQKIAHLRSCGDHQTELRERARGLYVLR